MADSFTEKPRYLDKTSLLNLTSPTLTIRLHWRQLAIPFGVFLVALLPRILNLDTFITADEDDQIMFATHFLKSVLRGDWSNVLILGYPGVPTVILGAIGVGARYLVHYMGLFPLQWVSADFNTTVDQLTTQFGVFEYPLDFLVWVRVPMALAASLSILGIYLLAKQLVDERVGLLAAVIFAFDPFILAHSRVIHVDAPLSYFMFLSFLAFLLYLDQGLWKWLLLSGLFGGLAGLSKTPAGLLGPILIVSGTLYAIFPPPGLARAVRWKRLFTALLIWGIVALATIFALWPTMWSRPIFAFQSLIRNIYSVSDASHPTTGIFWGNQQSDQNPLYYLIVFPYHLTPLTTVGVIGGSVMIVAGLVARWRNTNNWLTRILPLALGLVAYIVIFMAPISAISRRGDRYILPVFFAVGLLSALALWWLAKLAINRFPTVPVTKQLKLTPIHVVGLALLVQVLLVLLYHPYYLAYFNPAIAGSRTAPDRINVGWGEGLDLAAQYLNRITDDQEPPVVASWYSNQFAPYYKGQTIDLSSQEAALTADYTVLYLNQIQRGFPSQEILDYFRQREPVHVVELGGIEYAWIYEGPIIGQKPHKNHTFSTEALLGGAAWLYGVDIPVVEMPADVYVASNEESEAAPYVSYKQVKAGLPVTLYWETMGSIQDNHGKVNTYIHLVDNQGNIWGKVDRLILGGLWRPIRWYPGFFLRDEYKLPIDPATPPGTYHLEVGLYNFETGQHYGLVRNIGEIVLTPPQNLPDVGQLEMDNTISTPIDNALTLLAHNYSEVELPPGGEITGKIFWQVNKSTDKAYKLEFSFLGPDGKKYVVAQQPLSAPYPISQWRRSEIVGEAYRILIPAGAPANEYPLLVTVIDSDTGENIGKPNILAHITVAAQRRNYDLPEDVVPISAVLNDEIELVGYRLHDQTVKARETFGLTLYWRSLKSTAKNYTVFVHAVGPDQSIRGQWDSMPGQGTLPTGGWIPGEVIEDHYEVPMHRKIPPWKYDIFVGMYNSQTGERLPLFSPTAPVSDKRVWLTRIQVVD